jgi:hypothetical protein
MDDAAIRKSIREDNFFHHSPHLYLSHGTTSLDNPSAVVRDGINFLHRCKALEPVEFERRYKGTPFYWIGCAAFLANDFETAAFLFDAAASEDMREVREGVHPEGRITPALRFLRAEGDQPDQAAQALTQHLQRQLQAAIDDYNNRPGRSHIPLKLSDIQTVFLQHTPQQDTTLLTAFISFFLEWHHRSELAELGIQAGSAEPFILHLFKGCVLFESLLRTKVAKPTGDTLGLLLQSLARDLGILSTSSARMGQIGVVKARNTDFLTVVSLAQSNGRSIATAIALTELTRNKLGHRLDWKICFDRATFDTLAGCVATSLLHTIACLYR